MIIDRSGGKYALTQWRLLADFGNLSLLAVFPMTGRTHQIRVHLQSVGMPLAIDPLYGSQTPLFLSHLKADYRLGRNQVERPLIDRLPLHAYQLELNLTDLAEQMCFVAALDKHFSATLKMLTKYGPKGRQAFTNQNVLPDILAARRLSIE
jgi:23S rRNA-/tRNA-specific pseudouridylate synthase